MTVTSASPSADDASRLALPELGEVIALNIAPESGAAMEAVTELQVQAGVGIAGDRYHGSRHRHVSVQSAEELAEASTALGRTIEPFETRRTITLAHGRIPTTPGTELVIGSVRLEVVRIAAPCAVMDDEIGRGARAALRRRAGIVCRAVSSGRIALVDPAISRPA